MAVCSLCVVCVFLALAPVTRAIVVDNSTSLITLDNVLKVIDYSKKIGKIVHFTWDIITNPLSIFGTESEKENEVLTKLDQIFQDIRRLEQAMEQNGAITMLLRMNSRGTRLELQLHEITGLLNQVSAADQQMRAYIRHQKNLERVTLENFATWCVSPDSDALQALLERIHSLIVPPHRNLLGKGLLHLVEENTQQDYPEFCELQLSQNQLISDLYYTVSLTEIKGYAMMQFSWMLLRIYGKGNFTEEATLTRSRYKERTAQSAAVAKTVLAVTKRDLYRCDPPQHEEGKTYAQVTRLLQGYVENEEDLNKDGSCSSKCDDYTVAAKWGCYKDKYCSKQTRCSGMIRNCTFVESNMWICPAAEDSIRRYEWIKYESGRTFGQPTYCSRGTTEKRSWPYWLVDCSYCMCLCDEGDRYSDRYFSLMEALADIANNKVVTGLRLIKDERVFKLQISEGSLREKGAISPGNWVPVEEVDLDREVIDGEMIIWDDGNGIRSHKLTYEERAINLDELDSPAGSVLTGVRFQMLGSHLNFEIHTTPFNFTTGKLYTTESKWISNQNTVRRRLELIKPDIPTRSKFALPVDSTHGQYLEFVNSDFDADAAQSTVPFVDIQPVMPMQGSALLTGAGLIHRGMTGSGGFIGVKVFTYDFSKHIPDSRPPSAFQEEGVLSQGEDLGVKSPSEKPPGTNV